MKFHFLHGLVMGVIAFCGEMMEELRNGDVTVTSLTLTHVAVSRLTHCN